MTKFKEGDSVYHLQGNQAFKKTIIKVLPPPAFPLFPQRYIVKGISAGSVLSGVMGAADDIVNESDLTERKEQ